MKPQIEALVYYPVHAVKTIAVAVRAYITGFKNGFKETYYR